MSPLALMLAWAWTFGSGISTGPPAIEGAISVQINSDGGKRVSVRSRAPGACRCLAILIDSTAGYDPSQRVITLSVSIENRWMRGVTVPLRLYSWEDSIRISSVGGPTPGGRRVVEFTGADRILRVNEAPFPKSVEWSFDRSLDGAAANGQLLPGQRTARRTIRIALAADGPAEFIVVLRARGENANPFPDDPPVRRASDLIPGAPVVADIAGVPPGRVLAEVVKIRFSAKASIAERQAALDALGGKVIGATAPSALEPRTYFIRLPPDSTGAPVIAVFAPHYDRWMPQDMEPINIDSMLALGERRSPMFLSAVGGCASIRIRLAGGTEISADTVKAPDCGPIVPVLAAGSTYDPRTRVIKLRISLVNRWTRRVVAPARLYSWSDSINIALPAPAHPPTGRPQPWRDPSQLVPDVRVRWRAADSAIGPGADVLAGAVVWRYDTTLSPENGSGALEPRAKSTDRIIELQLDTAKVEEFTFPLRALAENGNLVSALPPATGDPTGAFAAANLMVVRSLNGEIPISRDLIDVTFHLYATQVERQAAVDSIRGTVVGGFVRHESGDGTYVIRIPAEFSGESLAEALKKIRSQGGVAMAAPIQVEGAATRYASERMSLVVRGCESFRVEVDEAKAVRASIVPGSYCGPIVPVLAEPATFDSASRTLRLDVAIANTWTREVTAPMELYAWNDSINIAGSQAPAGGAARRAARLEPSTNAGWNDDATIHSGERWSFELMWNRDGQYSVLPPGMRTPSRELRIRLPAGVSAFTIRLRVQTRNRRSVPAAVAEHPPSWIYADSAHIKNADGMVPVVRNVLDVAFAYGASRESMQAVIDSVQGRIIGGWGSLGAHVIVVKTDGSLEDLKRLEKKLKSMPQVSFADIEMLIPVSPNSYQPEPTKIIRRIPRPPDSTAAPARTPPSSASP